jgi:DNA-binding response OmpR family regulator
MVIEPEVLVRMSIADYLRECGYQVIEAAEATDVWSVLDAKVALDVVFAEVKLPGDTDGFALARRLRQTHPQIDVILTSGVATAAEKSQELCEQGPINKPYRAEEVSTRIKVLLERRRAAAQPK